RARHHGQRPGPQPVQRRQGHPRGVPGADRGAPQGVRAAGPGAGRGGAGRDPQRAASRQDRDQPPGRQRGGRRGRGAPRRPPAAGAHRHLHRGDRQDARQQGEGAPGGLGDPGATTAVSGTVTRRAGGRRRTAARPSRPLGRDLRVAVTSGITLAVLFLASLFFNPYVFLGCIWVLAALGMLELDVAFRSRGWRVATPVALGVSLVLIFGAYANGPSAQSLGLVLLLFGAVTWTLLDRGRPVGRGVAGVAASVAGTVLMTVWVPFLASYVGLLLARDEGRWLVLAT